MPLTPLNVLILTLIASVLGMLGVPVATGRERRREQRRAAWRERWQAHQDPPP